MSIPNNNPEINILTTSYNNTNNTNRRRTRADDRPPIEAAQGR